MEMFFGKKRILYFDCLRIFATFAVMILHIGAQNWRHVSVTSYEWQIFNFYDSIVRWSVPVFVMISGALFLNRNDSLGKIYRKNILRLILSFIFWSITYAFISYIQGSDLRSVLLQMVKGHYHMWFLYMIIGLYLIVPLVKKIVESKLLTRYFLVLALVFSFIIPQLIAIIALWNEEFSSVANLIVGKISFHFTVGYVGYFVLGYYLSKEELSVKIRKSIFICCLLGFAVTILGSSYVSVFLEQPTELFYGNFTLNVMFESVGVFLFFRYNICKIAISDKMEKFILKLSKYSFGMYMVHAMVIEQLNKILGLNTLTINPLFSVPIIGIIVFVISGGISYVFNHIPKLKKYIV